MIFLIFAIRTSWFQTWAAQQAASYFQDEWGTAVSIDKLDIEFFDEIYLEGVYVEDLKSDTLLYSDLLKVTIGGWDLEERSLDISQVLLENTTAKMRVYQGDTTFNFQFIADYFASEEEDTTTSEAFTVNVHSIALNNINFLMENQNIPKAEHGMDFNHLHFKQMGGTFSNFAFVGDSIATTIEDLHLKEQSGLILSNLSSEILYSPKLIGFRNLNIAMNNSLIAAPSLSLITKNGSEDFSDFLNKVVFSGSIKKSRLNLGDVAYFVPQIWGMDDDVDLNNIEIKGPVNGMQLNNVDISMLDTTSIQGNFVIPNMDNDELEFKEELILFRTSVKDVEKLNLTPFIAENNGHITIPKNLQAAEIIKVANTHFTGSLNSFIVDAHVYSGLGNVLINDEMEFHKMENGDYSYHPINGYNNQKNIVLENVNAAALTGSDQIGMIDGYINFEGSGLDPKTMNLRFNGAFNNLSISGYDYNDIVIKEGSFRKNILDCNLEIDDKYLKMKYEGRIDLNHELAFNLKTTIDTANLTKLLGLDTVDMWTASVIELNLQGTDVNKIKGTTSIKNFHFHSPNQQFDMKNMTVDIRRSETSDTINLKSDYIDAKINGKVDLLNIGAVIQTQLSYVLDNLIKPQEINSEGNDHFVLNVNLKNVNPILSFVDTSLYIAENTTITSSYDLGRKELELNLESERVLYSGMEFLDIRIDNRFDANRANLIYSVASAKPNDSLKLRNLYIDGLIKNNTLLTNAGYSESEDIKPGLFAFSTNISEDQVIKIDFDPSFFHVQGEKWIIDKNSQVIYSDKLVNVPDLTVINGDHYLKVHGKVSENPDDWLEVDIHDFDLANLNSLLGGEITLGGIINVNGGVADIFNNIKFRAESEITNLEINRELVGDVSLENQWQKATNSVSLLGNLKRDGKETFRFAGSYFVEKEIDNLKAQLIFENTDIGFLSAFEDEELYTDIKGYLNGNLSVNGELTNPVIKGKLKLKDTRVKVPMFNVAFGANGIISFIDGMIYSDHLDIIDQENNHGEIDMSINHTDWGDWNYDININLDQVGMSKKFLVMNTQYKDGDYYYGKAYISGFVNIFGYGDLTEITVEATTKEGTDLVLPLYGNTELSDESFMIFDTIVPRPGQGGNDEKLALESYGLELNMIFHVTRKAHVSIVFDPLLEDQIVVSDGAGDIEIKMDEYGEMSMFGTYTINQGMYDMHLNNVVGEKFIIDPGSTLKWTQSPYDALIDIRASFDRKVSLEPIMPLGSDDHSGQKELVKVTMIMTETLMSPGIAFSLSAPDAGELEKAALKEIEQNPDELNKQFFALLALQRFLPREGKSTDGGGSELVAGLVSDQINGLLGNVSGNGSIEADLGAGGSSLSYKKQVGPNIWITTSVGYTSGGSDTQDESTESATGIIGDVNVEYHLNDDGSFTLNFFNESNTGTDASNAPFTQGVGLHYEETFNTSKDFKLLQRFLNIFRKSENDVKFNKDKNNNKVPIPESAYENNTEGTNEEN